MKIRRGVELIRPTGAPHQGGADNKHTSENQKSESKMKTAQKGGKLGKKSSETDEEQGELEVLCVMWRVCAFIDVLSKRTGTK